MKKDISLYLRDGNFCEEGEFKKEYGYIYCYNSYFAPFPITIMQIKNNFEIKVGFEI